MFTFTALPAAQTAARPARARTSVVARLAHAMAVWRQRNRLESLPQHMLRDIGLTEGDVAREASRPLWDAPKHWRA